MPAFKPVSLFLPKNPHEQVMRSLDDYDREEILALKSHQKQGFIHIIQPEPKLQEKNIEIRKKWAHAVNEQQYLLKNEGVYLYKMNCEGRVYRGIIGACLTSDFEMGAITQHEKIYSQRVELMADYLKTVQIQAEPVMVIHEDPIDSKIDFTQIEKRTSVLNFNFEKTHHQLWELNKEERKLLESWCRSQPHFHLADGHHRVASMIHLSHQKKHPAPISCFLVHQSQFQLYSFVWYLKRCESDLDIEHLLQVVLLHQGKRIDLDPKATTDFEIIVKIRDTYYGLEGSFSNPPAFINQNLLAAEPKLAESLHYQPDTNQKIDFKKWENFDIVFFMKPITKKRLFDLVKKGENLPAKSTYILPKILTGLYVSPIE